jgi:3-hydroxyacyl-[acyl-carrier-protein] dehydratase
MKPEELYIVKDFKEDGTTFCASVVFNKEHWIYKAHFPQRPVTPGAMVLQVAEDLICKEMGKKFKMVTSKNVRFFNVITPNDEEILFKISYKKLAENWIEIGKNVGINETGPSGVCRIIDATCDVSDVSGKTSYAKISAVYNCY